MAEHTDTVHDTSKRVATAPAPSSGPPEVSENDRWNSFEAELNTRFGLTSGHRLVKFDTWAWPSPSCVVTEVLIPRSRTSSRTVKRTRDAVLEKIIKTTRRIDKIRSNPSVGKNNSELDQLETYKDNLIESVYGTAIEDGARRGIKFIENTLDAYTKLGGKRNPKSDPGNLATFEPTMKTLYKKHLEKVIGFLGDQEDKMDSGMSTNDIRKRRRKYDDGWLLKSRAWCDMDDSSITFILEKRDDLDDDEPTLRTNFTYNGLGFTHESSLAPDDYLSGTLV